MNIFNTIYSTVIESLFPTSKAEEVVLGINENDIYTALPRAKQTPIGEACSIFSYKDERVWRLIWSIKYKKSLRGAYLAAKALMKPLAYLMKGCSHIILVPMPITSWRRRERGFNQCELIADEIRKINDFDNLFIADDLLSRIRHKSRQTLKDKAHREESAKNLFKVNEEAVSNLRSRLIDVNRNLPANYLILVIDDVITTGSTIREAIITIRNAGLLNTFGMSIAH